MQNKIEITVNRRRFDGSCGVTSQMTAAEIAGLVGIPAQNAIVERETARNAYEAVSADAQIAIEAGMHFLVTRHFVMGG
ncbi:hypothetical protein [Chelatococcus asaccharovorans]|uniref:hypothetical protein n=1 Tax=Chelatococcus asaccharovorans TaxID=28210 RepID=UPI00224C7941|nr:hypothetical protein [Chelatococcus asaccharovorans]CAH1655402.1 conserved hypothetical protein [Chelatococcus asaccharovorans]CAH1685437.1 conserved hypothetical protein [Chelatococcus asaccharovorans]